MLPLDVKLLNKFNIDAFFTTAQLLTLDSEANTTSVCNVVESLAP